jgi:hypothetical protein
MNNDKETGRIFVSLMETNFELYNKPKPSQEVKEVWWKLLKGFELDDVKAAFGKHAIECKFAPKPADIIAALKEIHALKIKARRENLELQEREQQASLPPPTHNVDSIALLAEAKNQPSGISNEELIARHNALIAKDKRLGFIRTPPRLDNGKCAVSHCRMAGGLTTSLKGSDRFYCKEHFQA